MTFFRIYSGVAQKGMSIVNPRTGKRERFGRIVQMHANSREDKDELYSGDIGAAVGLKNVKTGDTLCFDKDQIVLESMEFPEPVISMAVEPKSTAERDKLGNALPRYLMKIQHLLLKQMKKPDRLLSVEWVNFILILLKTV